MKYFLIFISLLITKASVAQPPITTQAQFPGGKTAWTKFLEHHIPRDFSDSCVAGSKVTVSFIVSADSTLKDISCKGKILCNEPANIQLQNEIIQMIAKSGKWYPARSTKGKPISSIVTFPITLCSSTE